jgi:ubiquinone/menaquinone biosynthesis C-methylase UbiE
MNDRAFNAAQEFLLAAKTYWSTTMYGVLRETCEANYRGKGECLPQTVGKTAEILEDTTIYRYFAWLERHLQRLKYIGRYGILPFHNERRDILEEELNASSFNNSSLELDADLQLPHYYTKIDIHQHPGGIWSDAIAGFVYERGAQTTLIQHGKMLQNLHQRFTEFIAQTNKPQRVLDMGCGFGNSTQPFLSRFPEARIDAIDLSGPCLRLAAKNIDEDQACRVRYRQMDGCDTDYEESCFDMVTSTMFLHELPTKALDQLFSEIFRLLEPGARMVHLDFYLIPDAFRRFLHYGHGRRNNEPYMQPLVELDLQKMLESKGFVEIEISPFSETDAVDPQNSKAWRFPWTVISAMKPAN